MDATKGDGLTPPQSQPAKLIKHIAADFIAACMVSASRVGLVHLMLFVSGAAIGWGALK